MRLEAYWGVGPKTRDTLTAEMGAERAARAIETGNVRALTDAGLPRGRATRILRRATGGKGMDLLATNDALTAYKSVLNVVVEHAITDRAADRIRVLTPLTDVDAMESRLDAVLETRAVWGRLTSEDRRDVLDAYAGYDERDGSESAAVETTLALTEAGLDGGPFDALESLEEEVLAEASEALAALDGPDGRIRPGSDEALDRLRSALGAVEDVDADAESLVGDVQRDGVRGVEGFRTAIEDRLLAEVDVTVDRVREAMPREATDATDFVTSTLRTLRRDLTDDVDEREETVRRDLDERVAEARPAIDRAVAVVDDIALYLSLARFAGAYDCTRPRIEPADADESATVSVVGARNLTLAAREEETVQSVTYALGDHELDASDVPLSGQVGVPGEQRVTVLTGANSGGKTTLLETLCQVVLLATMGLPVPAKEATVTPVDALVFHRRHASFNAGVLESTLRSIVPPLADGGRTLMLVDEFEAITEPGRAADLLHGLVTLTVDRDALGVFVTHLADDLAPLPETARVDGIFAEGLDPDLELRVDYQPRFDTVGRSTPEFIVSRLVANANDRSERAGFETLAEAIGRDVVQRTLADARWNERT